MLRNIENNDKLGFMARFPYRKQTERLVNDTVDLYLETGVEREELLDELCMQPVGPETSEMLRYWTWGRVWLRLCLEHVIADKYTPGALVWLAVADPAAELSADGLALLNVLTSEVSRREIAASVERKTMKEAQEARMQQIETLWRLREAAVRAGLAISFLAPAETHADTLAGLADSVIFFEATIARIECEWHPDRALLMTGACPACKLTLDKLDE
jgi:hypothetical protein